MVGGSRIGIDFGTSHTVAMCQGRGDRVYPLLFDSSPLLPSAVFGAEGRLLVGRDAERSARLDPAAFEPYPKQRIDDGSILLGATEYPVVDVIAAVLRRCLDEAERVAGEPPEHVVLTHPAGWGRRRKAVLADAAARAGVDRVNLVAEPAAAAVYFSQVIEQGAGPDTVVVYDFGGGTFDVAVLRRRDAGWEVVANDGLDDVGGVDLDGVLIADVQAAASGLDPVGWSRLAEPRTATDRRNRRLLWDDARAAKEHLSRNPTAGLHVPTYDLDVHVTREEFELRARPLLERTVALTAQTLAHSGVARQQVAGLFLVGGSSRIPLVATLLHQRLGIAPTVIEQPELVVAQGSLLARPSVVDTAPVSVPAIGTATVPPPSSAPRPISAPVPTSPSPPSSVTLPSSPTSPTSPSAPTSPAPDPVDHRPDGRPAPPATPVRRPRRRLLVVAAGVVALVVVAAVVVVVLLNRPASLTAQGRTNAAAFTASALRTFAHDWLNDVTQCKQEEPNGGSSEMVNCTGGRWSVNFRLYPSTSERDQARTVRRTAYNMASERNLTGDGAGSGVRIEYRQEGQYQVVYWDDDGVAVSGDLYSTEMGQADLLAVWTKHVG